MKEHNRRQIVNHLKAMGFRANINTLVDLLFEGGIDSAASIDGADLSYLLKIGFKPPQVDQVEEFRNARGGQQAEPVQSSATIPVVHGYTGDFEADMKAHHQRSR
jgi:hypothetical protein